MSKIGDYVKSSYDELVHKTSWPTFQELQGSAIVVAVAALILAIIVFFMDKMFYTEWDWWKGILRYFYENIF